MFKTVLFHYVFLFPSETAYASDHSDLEEKAFMVSQEMQSEVAGDGHVEVWHKWLSLPDSTQISDPSATAGADLAFCFSSFQLIFNNIGSTFNHHVLPSAVFRELA